MKKLLAIIALALIASACSAPLDPTHDSRRHFEPRDGIAAEVDSTVNQ